MPVAGDDTQALGAARVELVAGLAAEVRRLTEAVLYSDVADAEIAAVRKQVAELADRLNAARRQEPPVAEGRTVGIEGRKAYVEATITGPDGSVTIEARATLIATPATRG